MTSAVSELPLIPSQPQRVAVALSGVGYQLTFTWCKPSSCWVMSVYDQSGKALAQGVPLLTGAGLLSQLEYLGIKGDMLAQSDDDANAVPTFSNLGVLGHLYYVTK